MVEPHIQEERDAHDEHESSRDEPTSPRAHCIVAGRAFQAIGLTLLFGSCVFWSLSGLMLTPAAEPARRWGDYLAGPHRAVALLTLDVVASCIGGLGLFGAGVGLNGERRNAGRVAMIATGGMGFVFVITALGFAVTGSAWSATAINSVLALLMVGLFLMATHCASLLRRFPPPEHHAVTDELLDQFRRERDERRRKYDI